MRLAPFWLLAVGVVAVLTVASLAYGATDYSLNGLFDIVAKHGGEQTDRIVVLQLRMPRLLAGLIVGSLLGVAGTILQYALRNELAGPEINGVTAGSTAVMAVIVVLQLPVSFWLMPLALFAGGLFSGAVVLATAALHPDPFRMTLIGAAMSAFFFAGVIGLIAMGTASDARMIYAFLLGSLAGTTWLHVWLLLPWLVAALLMCKLAANRLNIVRLGDDQAENLGVRPGRTRTIFFLISALFVAATVAVAGPVSFVALLAPHLARAILRTENAATILPATAIIAALLLVGADLLARTAAAPLELPIGMWTAVLGGPLFIALVRNRMRRALP